MSEVRIGISGWNYPLWRGTFYPADLPVKREFDFATARFATIEINGTFYRLQRPAIFRNWYESAPANCVFAIKGNKYITHNKRLKEVDGALANFFATGVLELQEKLGPILWQFPPQMKFNADRFRRFFELLPRTPGEAVKLARKHDMQIGDEDEPLFARRKAKLRYAVEIRNDSFKCDSFIDLLREYEIAYVIADTAERWLYAEDLTTDFVYIRLHGYKELYSGGYTDEALDLWAERVRHWQRGVAAPFPTTISKPTTKNGKKDIFAYFDNDAKVNAPYDAATLALKLKGLRGLVLPEVHPRDIVRAKASVGVRALKALQPRALNR